MLQGQSLSKESMIIDGSSSTWHKGEFKLAKEYLQTVQPEQRHVVSKARWSRKIEKKKIKHEIPPVLMVITRVKPELERRETSVEYRRFWKIQFCRAKLGKRKKTRYANILQILMVLLSSTTKFQDKARAKKKKNWGVICSVLLVLVRGQSPTKKRRQKCARNSRYC